MSFFAKKIEKQIASYQHRLIETHYLDVDNMCRRDSCLALQGEIQMKFELNGWKRSANR